LYKQVLEIADIYRQIKKTCAARETYLRWTVYSNARKEMTKRNVTICMEMFSKKALKGKQETSSKNKP